MWAPTNTLSQSQGADHGEDAIIINTSAAINRPLPLLPGLKTPSLRESFAEGIYIR